MEISDLVKSYASKERLIKTLESYSDFKHSDCIIVMNMNGKYTAIFRGRDKDGNLNMHWADRGFTIFG